MNTWNKVAFAWLLAMFCTVAQAVPIEINFLGPNALGLASGALGSSATVVEATTGANVLLSVGGTQGVLDRDDDIGLGVTGFGGGLLANASVLLDFSPATVAGLNALVFLKDKTAAGKMEIWIDGVFARKIKWQIGAGKFSELSLVGLTGSVFEFRGMNTPFRLAGVKVDYPTYSAMQVPSPSALWCALLALPFFGRRLDRQ
ncbi:MAG: hypothetical protein AAF384_10460 [Pseudomonadota bacterium]